MSAVGAMAESEPKKQLIERLSDWLFQQGVSTILLFTILGLLYWGMRYAMDVAVPRHLDQIRRGYQELDARQHEREAARQQHNERFLQAFERDQERDYEFYGDALETVQRLHDLVETE